MARTPAGLRATSGSERGGDFLHHLREPLRHVLGEKANNKICVIYANKRLHDGNVELSVRQVDLPRSIAANLTVSSARSG